MARVKRGLKRGLRYRTRTLILFTDETIITETPPLRKKWTLRSERAEIPITGDRNKRVVYGTINIHSGDMVLHHADQWNQHEYQTHLQMIRSHWRGWNLVLFADQGSPHTAELTELLADELGIEYRYLPTATPELNPMDTLWGHVKNDVLADLPTPDVDDCVEQLYLYLHDIGPSGCLKKSGILADNFWLREFR